MSKRVVHVVTAVDASLMEAWHVLERAGFEQLTVSPVGGAVPVEDSVRAEDAAVAAVLRRTAAPGQIDAGDFDAILCTRDVEPAMTDDAGLDRLVTSIRAHGGVVDLVDPSTAAAVAERIVGAIGQGGRA